MRNNKRGFAWILALLVFVGALASHTVHAAIPGNFCVSPSKFKGMGSFTQNPIWKNHFIPQYEQRCPDGVNLVKYDSLGDAAGVDAAIGHEMGDSFNPYLIYSTDIAMTYPEKLQTESDTRHAFTLRPQLSSFINHFPAFVYGVAVGYNLGDYPDCASTQPLKLNSRQLSLIYSGAISLWSDPILVLGEPGDLSDDNAFLANCDITVRPIIRLDDASSTLLFKDYLSRDNALFNLYKTKELNTIWPSTLVALTAWGDEGMSGYLTLPGAIGYVPYQVARSEPFYRIAKIGNASRTFVGPALNIDPGSRSAYPEECSTAANTVVVGSTSQDWSQVRMTTTASGYPICSFSFFLVFVRLLESYGSATSPLQAKTVSDFLTVMAEDPTQDGLRDFGVAPLGAGMRIIVRNGIQMLSY